MLALSRAETGVAPEEPAGAAGDCGDAGGLVFLLRLSVPPELAGLGLGAFVVTSLTGATLILVVYYNLVTALVSRREDLLLKRLRAGELSDSEIVAGMLAPAVVISWGQILLGTIAAVAVFHLTMPVNPVLVLAAVVGGTAVFSLLALVDLGRDPERPVGRAHHDTRADCLAGAQRTHASRAVPARATGPDRPRAAPHPGGRAAPARPHRHHRRRADGGPAGHLRRRGPAAGRHGGVDCRRPAHDATLVPVGATALSAGPAGGDDMRISRHCTSQGWTDRPGVERIDLYTRAPLYAVSASEPVVLLLLVSGQDTVRPWGAAILVVLGCAHTVACLRLLHAALAARSTGTGPDVRLVAATLGLTAAGLAAGPAAFPAYGTFLGSDGFPVGLATVVVFCGALTVAVTPVLPWRGLLPVLAGPAAVLGVLQVVVPTSGEQPPWALTYLLVLGALVLTYRSSAWVLDVVWKIDQGREVQARLAVAEERLRVARDVHDVLGRNLTLIAVNSELAAQLAHRDTDEAVQRMRQVHATAQESMKDVREVVSGERHASLDVELAGARSVLRSAGIAVRVVGDSEGLPPGVQAGLGWAVREATTNILRHAEPAAVTIDLTARSDEKSRSVARLRIENDGVRADGTARQPAGHGTGLDGLRQRLAQLGGDLTAAATPNGRFVVEAQLPLEPPSPTRDRELV